MARVVFFPVFVSLALLCVPHQLIGMEESQNSPTVSIGHFETTDCQTMLSIARDPEQPESVLNLILETLAHTKSCPEVQAYILIKRAKNYIYGSNGYPINFNKACEIFEQILRLPNLDRKQKHEAELAHAELTSPHGPTRNDRSGIFDFSDPHNGFVCS